MRQIVLDTETTGLDHVQGHRIIEIGCLELVNRRLTKNTFHEYLNPGREIDEGALAVHGISSKFLADKPSFIDIAEKFLAYVKGAELIIHNAAFDIGFLDAEFTRYYKQAYKIMNSCNVIDTLVLARKKHPGQRNSLDALCKRYNIDNSHREYHGALLDARLLAGVYLQLTGGQTELFNEELKQHEAAHSIIIKKRKKLPDNLTILSADTEELADHQQFLEKLRKSSKQQCVWDKLKPDITEGE